MNLQVGRKKKRKPTGIFSKTRIFFPLGSVKFFAGNIDETFLPNKLKPIIPKCGQGREEGSTLLQSKV